MLKSIKPAIFCVCVTLGLSGCQTSSPPQADNATVDGSSASHDHDEGEHLHPTEGPHGGELIELGNEEYHAELVHNEAEGSVTLYVLDGAAKVPVAIDAIEVTINAKHQGEPVQFKLAANAETDDPTGKSSRFVSTDAQLGDVLDEEGADARLVLKINEKSYRGQVAHRH
ncbi:MAG: hypothetical protein R3C05_03520 [Pirellulaceae bacterium]